MQDKESQEFFPGFVWAVRKAFREPLASCRFEQGDILYDTRKAYEGTWGDAFNYLHFSIQINSPKRGITTKNKKDAASVFAYNWGQLVELDLVEYPSKKTRFITTTQGRLYTTLWKGDISLLEDGTLEPPVPKLAKDALKVLKDIPFTSNMILKKCSKGLRNPFLFIMPFDETNEILRKKLRKVETHLKKFQPQTLLDDPEEFGLLNANEYVPTVNLACFIMDSIDQEELYAKLKEALYVKSKGNKTNKEIFRPKNHGYLHPDFKSPSC
jgi:hypothetical protein